MMTEDSSKEDVDLKKDTEMEEGELPEEGEIMDDEDEKLTTQQKHQQVQQKQRQQQRNGSVSPPSSLAPIQHSGSGGREFNHRATVNNSGGGGSSTWRRSFGGSGTDGGGHHQYRRGGATGKFAPNRGGDHNAGVGRYRGGGGYDAHMPTKQDEEMIDSWVRGAYRKGGARTGGNSPRGDISPIRTSPMIEMSPPTSLSTIVVTSTVGDGSIKEEQQQKQSTTTVSQPPPTMPIISKDEIERESTSPSKQVVETSTIAANTQQLEDDRDFRMAAAAAAAATSSSDGDAVTMKPEPTEPQLEDDDNDYRRHHQQQQQQVEQPPPTQYEGESLRMAQQQAQQHRLPLQQFGGRFEEINMRRRPHSLSPPSQNTFVDEHHEHADDDYGPPSTVKRQRPYYDEPAFNGPPSQGSDGPFTPNNSFEANSGPFHGNGGTAWQTGHGRGGFHNNRGGFAHGGGGGGEHSFGEGDGPGGGGPPPPGRTQGFGYRGGRPFFPRLICKFFREGYCRDGEQCTFSHATADSHRRPDLCKFYQQGFCKKNLFCQMMHGEWPCKAFHKGECSKEQCMFSHQPLDDVSGPILDKMIEQERLGLSNGPGLHHGPIHHTPQGPGGFYRPRFQQQQGGTPQHQHPHQQQQCYQPVHPQQIQQHHQGPPIEQQQKPSFPAFNQQQQPSIGVNVEAFGIGSHKGMDDQLSTGILDEQRDDIGGTPGPNIPSPTLVVPPILVQQQQQHQSQANAGNNNFGFFNRTGTVGPALGNQPSMQVHAQQPTPTAGVVNANFVQTGQAPHMTPPQQPTFQQLQQQVQQHQQVGFSHFPHQPSLLGPPSATTTPPMSRVAPQQFGGSPLKQEYFVGNQLGMTIPSFAAETHGSPPLQQQTKGEKPTTGGFNINQMLEQITKQKQEENRTTPPQSITTSADMALDLFASVGLGVGTLDNTMLEESPASPTDLGDQQQQSEEAATPIPMVCEWKLHPVDIPTTEGPNVHFDIKLVQQISSSNSDPRLRKLAEKQFDLVSKALEQQQATQKATNNGGPSGTGATINASDERVVIDPRKDPRRKSMPNKDAASTSLSSTNAEQQDACTVGSSSSSSFHLSLPSTSSNDPSGTCSTQYQSQQSHQISYDPSADELLSGYGYNGNKSCASTFATASKSENISSNNKNETDLLVQQQMAAMFPAQQTQSQQQPPLGFIGQMSLPPSLQQSQTSVVTTFAQALSGMVTGTTTAVPPPNFLQNPPPTIFPQAQGQPSPTVPFFACPPPQPFVNVPPPQIQQQKSQLPPLNVPQQQLGAHAFDIGGFNSVGSAPPTKTTPSGGGYRGRRGGGRQYHHPQHNYQKQQQQSDSHKLQEQQQMPPVPAPPTMVLSLREKRKNNEYESPLARIASASSSSSTGADRF